ncbi:tRNA-binding protein [Spirulina major CS-329]|uniref:tRNA-binding protein n=1 Tax=Spirulina TaxID=1154 RepID=UPI0023306116|nr:MULTISPECIES: tRNA-binding protein [Spirulina]MDB9493942.1 tRNA-binding protein [Spirulina subsalsa CS-330]MDB9503701.1 tRNA-binding protein [Spirulina major CS-329]
MHEASYADFLTLEIHTGTIIRAEPFPAARKPAYRLWIDFGPLGVKKSSAQITDLYTPDSLIGRMITAITNIPPRQIANFMSEVLVLGVVQADGSVVLLEPERPVAAGQRIA